MKRVVIRYCEATNMIHLPDGVQMAITCGNQLQEAVENDILQLVKAGLTAEDLIKLKEAELL